MSKGYLIISADCHAGPDSPAYRQYLDPQYRDRFDDELAARDALMKQMRKERFGTDDDVFAGSEEFQEEWFGVDEHGESLHEVGLRGGWDAKRRDEELSADGVTGEVVFPGPDAVTGKMGAPFGAGFAIDATADPELVLAGARAYNRWAAELCAASPQRRAGLIVAPILGDLEGAIRGDHARARRGPVGRCHHPRAVGRVPVVHQLPLRPDLGAVRVVVVAGAHALGASCARRLRRGARGPRALRDRDGVVDGAAHVVPPVVGRVRAVPEAEDGGHGVGVVLGARHAVAYGLADPEGPGFAQARRQRQGTAHDAAERVLRPQLRARIVEHAPARAGATLRDRDRQHHVGQRLPASRGHVAVHQADPRARRSGTSPSTRPSASSGSTRRSSTASTSMRCARSRRRSGRRPTSSARPTRRCWPSGTTCAPPVGTG